MVIDMLISYQGQNSCPWAMAAHATPRVMLLCACVSYWRAFRKLPKTFTTQKRFLKFDLFQVAVNFIARRPVPSGSST